MDHSDLSPKSEAIVIVLLLPASVLLQVAEAPPPTARSHRDGTSRWTNPNWAVAGMSVREGFVRHAGGGWFSLSRDLVQRCIYGYRSVYIVVELTPKTWESLCR
jgi:hypothetical protein